MAEIERRERVQQWTEWVVPTPCTKYDIDLALAHANNALPFGAKTYDDPDAIKVTVADGTVIVGIKTTAPATRMKVSWSDSAVRDARDYLLSLFQLGERAAPRFEGARFVQSLRVAVDALRAALGDDADAA